MAGKIQWNDGVKRPNRRARRPRVEFTSQPKRVYKRLEIDEDISVLPEAHWSRWQKVVPQTGHYDEGDLLVTSKELYIPTDAREKDFELRHPMISDRQYYFGAETVVPEGSVVTYMGTYKKRARSRRNGRPCLQVWDMVFYESTLYLIGPSLKAVANLLGE